MTKQKSGIYRKEGYEYHYRLRADDDVIPDKLIDGYEPSFEKKVYFFEIETNFVLKRLDDGDDGDEMGSENYCMCMQERDGEDYLKRWMGYRMEAYLMPDEAIEYLVSRAFEFAKRCSVEDDDKLVVQVAMDLDVRTVQLERESVEDAFDRAVRAECLIPLFLWKDYYSRDYDDDVIGHVSMIIDTKLRGFLESELLGKMMIRVEDDVVDRGLSSVVMETCPICLRGPTVGARISVLPCRHAFHSACIVRWLMKNNSCPSCRFPAHGFPVCKNLPVCRC